MSKHVGERVEKCNWRTDTRADRYYHTIIRVVWSRVYKNVVAIIRDYGGHFLLTDRLENTILVEDIEYLLPV